MPSDPLPTTYTLDDDERLSTALLDALSEAKGRDISTDECVLYDSIDPDALDVMFSGHSESDTVKVEFSTHDAIVVIWSNGGVQIEVQDLESDPNYGPE